MTFYDFALSKIGYTEIESTRITRFLFEVVLELFYRAARISADRENRLERSGSGVNIDVIFSCHVRARRNYIHNAFRARSRRPDVSQIFPASDGARGYIGYIMFGSYANDLQINRAFTVPVYDTVKSSS